MARRVMAMLLAFVVVGVSLSGRSTRAEVPARPFPLVDAAGSQTEITGLSDDGNVVLVVGEDSFALDRRTGTRRELGPYERWAALTADGTAAYRVSAGLVQRLDLPTGMISTVELPLTGDQTPSAIAVDGVGRWVAVTTTSASFAQLTIVLLDTVTGQQIDLRAGFDDVWPQLSSASLSNDGRFVAYQFTDTLSSWGQPQVFLFDRLTSATTRVLAVPGQAPTGPVFSPQVAADGSSVAFLAGREPVLAAFRHYDIELYDIASGTTRVLATANDEAPQAPAYPSNGGTRVAYEIRLPRLPSGAQNMTQVFVWDQGDTAELVTMPDGSPLDGPTHLMGMSADGSAIAFHASTLSSPWGTRHSMLALLPPAVPPTSPSTTIPSTTPIASAPTSSVPATGGQPERISRGAVAGQPARRDSPITG